MRATAKAPATKATSFRPTRTAAAVGMEAYSLLEGNVFVGPTTPLEVGSIPVALFVPEPFHTGYEDGGLTGTTVTLTGYVSVVT